MSAEENRALVRRFYDGVVNKGDLAAADELLAADYMEHSGSRSTPGRDAFKQFLQTLAIAFPDIRLTIDDMIAENDKVVVRVTVQGTHEGVLFGNIPPTGRTATWRGVDILRISGGKIVERWNCRDLLGMLQQLGVISDS
jgi:steroid delta-isomerase-like uncharacterized protein